MKTTKPVGSSVAIPHKVLKYNLVRESKAKYESWTDKLLKLTH